MNGTVDEETGHGSAPTLQQVKGEIQQSMDVMKKNMHAMAERETQLLSLDEKSAALQSVSIDFERGAKRLYRQQMWQRYRLCVALVGTIVWAACLVLFRHHLTAFLTFTATAAVAAFLADHLPASCRWSEPERAQMRLYACTVGDWRWSVCACTIGQ